VKTVTFFPGNAELDPALALHTHMATIELLSRSTGEPLALMDGRLITEMRTAAVSAVALDALAPKDVASLGIMGSGVQARSHLRALRMVRPQPQRHPHLEPDSGERRTAGGRSGRTSGIQ